VTSIKESPNIDGVSPGVSLTSQASMAQDLGVAKISFLLLASRAVSIHVSPSEDHAMWHFLEENATWRLRF
jgi:hypothetical protein